MLKINKKFITNDNEKYTDCLRAYTICLLFPLLILALFVLNVIVY